MFVRMLPALFLVDVLIDPDHPERYTITSVKSISIEEAHWQASSSNVRHEEEPSW